LNEKGVLFNGPERSNTNKMSLEQYADVYGNQVGYSFKLPALKGFKKEEKSVGFRNT
jgi:hypothetical protein